METPASELLYITSIYASIYIYIYVYTDLHAGAEKDYRMIG